MRGNDDHDDDGNLTGEAGELTGLRRRYATCTPPSTSPTRMISIPSPGVVAHHCDSPHGLHRAGFPPHQTVSGLAEVETKARPSPADASPGVQSQPVVLPAAFPPLT